MKSLTIQECSQVSGGGSLSSLNHNDITLIAYGGIFSILGGSIGLMASFSEGISWAQTAKWTGIGLASGMAVIPAFTSIFIATAAVYAKLGLVGNNTSQAAMVSSSTLK